MGGPPVRAIRMASEYLYSHPTLAIIYDVTCGWSEDRDFYLNLSTGQHQTIMDIGCGTGLLCRAYAEQGNNVIGLDPSAAMLAVAQEKSQGDSIRYIQGTADDVGKTHPELRDSVDLIIMTGHAFQCVTSDAAVVELFVQVKSWLKDDGRFVFESRNPEIDWIGKWHNSSITLDSEFGRFDMRTKVTSHCVVKNSSACNVIDTIEYKHRYEFEQQTIEAGDTLRFMPLSDILALLKDAGFAPVTVYGDWFHSSFNSAESEEMIFVAQPLM